MQLENKYLTMNQVYYFNIWIREGSKKIKKISDFSDTLKTHPPGSKKKIKKTWSKNHF